jgi:hypothetical protein
MKIWSLLAGLLLGFFFVSLGAAIVRLREERKRAPLRGGQVLLAIGPPIGVLWPPMLWTVVMKHGFDLSTAVGTVSIFILAAFLCFRSRSRKAKCLTTR